MRPSRSAAAAIAAILGIAGPASGACCRLDLLPGPLSSAFAALAGQTELSVGTTEPALLKRRLPALHLAGSVEAIMHDLGRRAGVRATKVQAGRWRIETAPSSPVRLDHSPLFLPAPDIIVLASKRDEPLWQSAFDVTRIDADRVGRNGQAADMEALLATTSSVATTGWGEGREKLFVRGIADSSFTGTSPALVGEYWGDQRLTFTAPDPDLRLYDIDSVEVLAGPQGTLYGSASMAGVLRVEPKPPVLDRFEGSAWADITNVAHGGVGQDVGGAVNLPLVSNKAAVRVVGYEGVDPGYIDDSQRDLSDINRTLVRGGRVDVRIGLPSGWTADLMTLAQKIRNRDAPYVDAGDAQLARASSFAQPSLNSIWLSSLTLRGPVGNLDLRSTLGIVRQHLSDLFEVHRSVGAPFAASQNDRPALVTEDLRISSSGTGWNWVAGLSLLDARDTDTRLYKVGTVAYFDTNLNQHTDEVTAFGEVTRAITWRLSLTLGLRIQNDRIRSDGLFKPNQFVNFLSPTPTYAASHGTRALPSLGISFQLRPRTSLFVRYERSYRPGGLTVGEQVSRYASDALGSFEFGLRHGIAGRDKLSLTIVGAASYWHHVQADLLDGLGLPIVANIGDGHIYSLDTRLNWRIGRTLSADVSVSLAHSHLVPTPELAAEGHADRLPNVAADTISAALDYSGLRISGVPVDLEARLRRVGRSLPGVGPELAIEQGDFVTFGLGATLDVGPAVVTAGIDNLLDSHATMFAIGTPFALHDEQEVTPLRPRTVRVGMKYLF